jgi:hypothetical protein
MSCKHPPDKTIMNTKSNKSLCAPCRERLRQLRRVESLLLELDCDHKAPPREERVLAAIEARRRRGSDWFPLVGRDLASEQESRTPSQLGSTVLAVVEEILRENPIPMSVREIVQRAGARLPSKSKTPDTVVARDLSIDMKRKGDASRFVRTSPGRYTLREFAQREPVVELVDDPLTSRRSLVVRPSLLQIIASRDRGRAQS